MSEDKSGPSLSIIEICLIIITFILIRGCECMDKVMEIHYPEEVQGEKNSE